MMEDIEDIYKSNTENWKQKVDKYTKILRIQNQLKSNEYFDQNVVSVINCLLSEANVLVLDASLELILSYCEISKHGRQKIVEDCSFNLIEKYCRVSRNSSKKILNDIFLNLYNNHSTELFLTLLKILKDFITKPVMVNNCLELVMQIIGLYPDSVITKKLCDFLLKSLESRDNNTRSISKKLVVKMAETYGENSIKLLLKELKPILAMEITEEINKNKNIINSQDINSDVQSEGTIDETIKPEHISKVPNLKQNYDVFDILPYLTIEFYEKLDGDRKSRKSCLDSLYSKLDKDITLKQGNLKEIIRKLCEIIKKDSQIANVIISCGILTLIANKSSKGFSHYTAQIVEACIEKFKEKKTSVLIEIRNCVDATLPHLSNLDSIIQVILDSLNNKNPNIRCETIKFLIRIINYSVQLQSSCLKYCYRIMPILSKLCEDSVPEVRDCVFQLIALFMIIKDVKTIQYGYLDGIDSNKMKRIIDTVNTLKQDFKSYINYNNDERNIDELDESLKIISLASTNPTVKSKSVFSTNRIVKRSSISTNTDSSCTDENKTLGRSNKDVHLSEDEVWSKCLSVFGRDINPAITNSKWQIRLETCEFIIGNLKNRNITDKSEFQAIVKAVLSKPGLKDPNIITLKKRLDILEHLFNVVPFKISNFVIDCCLLDIIYTMGEIKLEDRNRRLLNKIMTKTDTPLQVIHKLMHSLSDSKSVKCVIEVLQWLSELLSNWNDSNHPIIISIKEVIGSFRQLLQSTNVVVRQKTIQLIGAIYKHCNGKFSITLFSNERPIIIEEIKKELASVQKEMSNEIHETIQKTDIFKYPQQSSMLSTIPILTKKSIDSEIEDSDEENIDQRKSQDEARMIAMDLFKSISNAMKIYGKDEFLSDFRDVLTNIRCFGESNMQNVFKILQTELHHCFVRTEDISTQTDSTCSTATTNPMNYFSSRKKASRSKFLRELNQNEIIDTKDEYKAIYQQPPVSYFEDICKDVKNKDLDSAFNEIRNGIKNKIYANISTDIFFECIVNNIVNLCQSYFIKYLSDENIQDIVRINQFIEVLKLTVCSETLMPHCNNRTLVVLLRYLYSIMSSSQNYKTDNYWITLMKNIAVILHMLSTRTGYDKFIYALLVLLKDLLKSDSSEDAQYHEIVTKNAINAIGNWRKSDNVLDRKKYLEFLADAFNEYYDDKSLKFRVFKTLLAQMITKYGNDLYNYLPDKEHQKLLDYMKYTQEKMKTSLE